MTTDADQKRFAICVPPGPMDLLHDCQRFDFRLVPSMGECGALMSEMGLGSGWLQWLPWLL